MSLVLEIGGLFGLAVPLAFWGWRTDRRLPRERENPHLRGLTSDQLRMLDGIQNPEELGRVANVMRMVNDASRRLIPDRSS